MIDQRIDALLTRTARDSRYPETPDLNRRVLRAIATRPAAPPSGRLPAFSLALATALLVLVAALAISPSREAIARLFGVEGSRIEFLPTPAPGITPTPFPTTAPGQGRTVELRELPVLAGFEAALPTVADPRLGSTLLIYGGHPVAVHHYPAFDLWQTDLGMRPDAGFGKGVPDDGIVEDVEVGGVPGVWVSGGDHFVYYYDASGMAYRESQRTVERSTLIWRTDAFFYRIETDLTLEEALRIAVTLP
jgi:hypothetical protein